MLGSGACTTLKLIAQVASDVQLDRAAAAQVGQAAVVERVEAQKAVCHQLEAKTARVRHITRLGVHGPQHRQQLCVGDTRTSPNAHHAVALAKHNKQLVVRLFIYDYL